MPYVPVSVVEVTAWGRRVGAIAAGGRGTFAFEYDDAWIRSGVELSPIVMPLRRRRYAFPELSPETYQGLPPMIADSLPDRFGNALVDSWLAREGISSRQISALDRLAYLGPRGLGALEYVPDRAPHAPPPTGLDLAELIMTARSAVHGSLASEAESEDALRRIIDVGTSAGGARAKAIVNYDHEAQELRSGHLPAEPGFESWLLKFDGIGDDHQLGASGNYGRIEYAYSLMAKAAGIRMPDTMLLREHGRAHFMTKRFDRTPDGRRLHMQTLCGLAALDFNLIGTHDYAQYFSAIDELGLGADAREQAWRRMVFNVVTANCDDHTKNFAFLRDEPTSDAASAWSLAPAYDVTHAHSSTSRWTAQHLMSVNGRFRDITRADVLAVADRFEVPGAVQALGEIADAVDSWPEFAARAETPTPAVDEVARDFQLGVARRLR